MKRKKNVFVSDKIAQDLEIAGFYRRAATRWLQVFFKCKTDSEREWVSRRRMSCLKKIYQEANELPRDNLSEVYRAVKETYRKMESQNSNLRDFNIKKYRKN